MERRRPRCDLQRGPEPRLRNIRARCARKTVTGGDAGTPRLIASEIELVRIRMPAKTGPLRGRRSNRSSAGRETRPGSNRRRSRSWRQRPPGTRSDEKDRAWNCWRRWTLCSWRSPVIPVGFRSIRAQPPTYASVVPPFPYSIAFVELPTVVRILAIAHERRRPGYWAARLKGPRSLWSSSLSR